MRSPSDSRSPRPSAVKGHRRSRLLIVEDDAALRDFHALILGHEGYRVETAQDGANALELLAVETFDLILTDRFMPKLDGATMLLAIRSAGLQTPVVMISGSLGRASLPAAVSREFAAMLPKPARPSEVISAVSSALRRQTAGFFGQRGGAPETGEEPGGRDRSSAGAPPVARIMLTHAAQQRQRGAITTVSFTQQVQRIAREELAPRGLEVVYRDLPEGFLRFIIRSRETRRVIDMIDCPAQESPGGRGVSRAAENHGEL